MLKLSLWRFYFTGQHTLEYYRRWERNTRKSDLIQIDVNDIHKPEHDVSAHTVEEYRVPHQQVYVLNQ